MRCCIGVSDHTADILTDNMDWRSELEMIMSYDIQVVCNCDLAMTEFGMRRTSSSSIVGTDGSVSSFRERSNYMSKLI